MPKYKQISMIGMLAASVALTSAGSLDTASASANKNSGPSFTLQSTFNTDNKVPIATPLWSAEIDKRTSEDRLLVPSVVGDKNVYYIKSGKLIARSIETGKTLWLFGSGLRPASVVTSGNFVYVGNSNGVVYKVNQSTGKGTQIYQSKDKTMAFMKVDAGMLYVFSESSLTSINLASGKLKWTVDSDNAGRGEIIFLDDMLLISTLESGATMMNTFYAIDKATGKSLWRLGGSHDKLLKADGDRLYFRNDWPFNGFSTHAAQIDIINKKTGKEIGSRGYVENNPNIDPSQQWAQDVTIEGAEIYIVTKENQVYSYNLADNPDEVEAVTVGDAGSYLTGPYNGKFFFQNDTNNLGFHGRKLVDQSYVYYEGLDNPASQVNFIDSGMYVGQTDGEIYALNVSTGNAKFRFQTSSRNYAPFQVAGKTLIVQTEDKLYGFRLPDELLEPIGSGIEGEFKKVQAGLMINGKKKELKTDMLTFNNRMFVPMRLLMQEIGAEVSYDAASKKVKITYGTEIVTLTENSKTATKAGNNIPISYGPKTLNGILYAPIGDLDKLLEIDVEWHQKQRIIAVTTKVK
ncbi:PQQ enzyme repeat-containing protein [Paenibacillaceae bacterium GAS479]|nr:PQQ enzyme repeat-containing protein [Paenibacillaceae bacterium GAS479]